MESFSIFNREFLLKNFSHKRETYFTKNTYQGLIYSSVKEIETYVGSNVSFHTFMTAINNPHSKIYTVRIDQSPYHGVNCKAYYGTVCSAFVSASKKFRKLTTYHPDSIQVGDVLYKKDHVALITGLAKDESGHVKALEISEATQHGCVRNSITSLEFEDLMNTKYLSVHRYLQIDNNLDYQPLTEFVPVMGEQATPFVYNDDICVDKGDKSCYLEGEEVVVNIMHSVDKLEIYKDNSLYQEMDINDNLDISLKDLPYGDYKARVSWGDIYSDYTYWKVVNVKTKLDRVNSIVYFSSANAIPYFIRGASITGSKGDSNILSHSLTDQERMQGYVNIPQDSLSEKYCYLHVTYKTDYGNIIDKPKKWY